MDTFLSIVLFVLIPIALVVVGAKLGVIRLLSLTLGVLSMLVSIVIVINLYEDLSLFLDNFMSMNIAVIMSVLILILITSPTLFMVIRRISIYSINSIHSATLDGVLGGIYTLTLYFIMIQIFL